MVIDSIQTMYLDTLDSAPGTVSQVRASAQELIRLAKPRGFCVILVGHVTKEGIIAGPRVLEHMVDTVLYFEGERGHQFRILRAVKNRFGPTDEIGVFEMTDAGLAEVPNPSALFLADRSRGSRGEMTRSSRQSRLGGVRRHRRARGRCWSRSRRWSRRRCSGTPRRAVVGWDGNRLAMVLAVLEARCGLLDRRQRHLSQRRRRLAHRRAGRRSGGGGGAGLGAAREPVPADTVVFGEIGLSGEVRPVGQAEARLKEAAKLGFADAWVPSARRDAA